MDKLQKEAAMFFLYGGDKADRLCLHAYSISFTHPSSGDEMMLSSEINHYR